ncbi:methyltransferase domain-containing protein [Actinophytocola sediminis]
MNAIVIVWHAEDAVLEMLSVIERPENVEIIIVSRRETLSLSADSPLADRLDQLAPQQANTQSDDRDLREWLSAVCERTGDTEIWTHSPADSRPTHAKVGWLLAEICPTRAWHSVGQNRFLEMVPDRTVAMSRTQVTTKIDFVNRYCADLLRDNAGARQVQTHAVAVVERFLRVDRLAANRLFGLASSAEDSAAVAVDPWDFDTSEYEAERLRATTSWIGDWCPPGHVLIEIGACEGALTTRLADKGHQIVATEPNAVFRSRLTTALAGREVSIRPDSLADLTRSTLPPTAAVLLIEMLYYGQDLDLINALPADMLFMATDPDQMTDQVKPWLATNSTWRLLDERALGRPRMEFVGAGHGFIRKKGSIGLVCDRSQH